MATRWTYLGDVDPQNGGMLIRVCPEHGYADVARITPCADAGGPSNMFWIEALTVVGLDNPLRRENAARACSWNVSPTPRTMREWVKLAEMFVSYGYYDPANCHPKRHTETVQVGPDDPFYDFARGERIAATVRLRSNANIMRYLRAFANERM